MTEEDDWTTDDPASRFFRAFVGWESTLPDGLTNVADFQKRAADLVHLDHLFVPDDLRGRGWGRRIMERIVTLADAHAVTLTLNPAWLGDGDPSVDLPAWYSHFGFTISAMIRQPMGGPGVG